MKKRCPKCTNILDTKLFDKSKLTKDGFQSWCKSCRQMAHALKNNRPIHSIIESLPDEIWADLSYISNGFEVSNMGRVKSLHRPRSIGEKILKPYDNGHGYLHIDLGKKTKKVHRLVAFHFIPNPENKKYVNHKKGDKYDNRASELEWNTFHENMQHAFATGLIKGKQGATNCASKLTEKQVMEIYQSNESQVSLSKKYKVSNSTIWSIIHNETWTHITKNLPFRSGK